MNTLYKRMIDAGHDQADDAFANTDEAATRQVMADVLANLLPAFQ